MASVDEVDAAQTRLAEHGLASIDERGTTCCYATQDKFWVPDTPSGERWEIYTVLADSQTVFGEATDGPACCAGDIAAAAERTATSVKPGPTTASPAGAVVSN